MQQVTRGHNIVADGWAGASNPHPHPMPPHQHTYPKKHLKCSFFHFSTRALRTDRQADGRTNGQTDGWTDQRTKPLIELRVRN